MQGRERCFRLVKHGFYQFLSVSFLDRAAPQKFGVYFGKLRQLPLKFQVRGDAPAGLLTLRRSLEQKLSHPAGAQAAHQIKKRPVLKTALAAAVLFSARQVLFDVRGVDDVGRHPNLI